MERQAGFYSVGGGKLPPNVPASPPKDFVNDFFLNSPNAFFYYQQFNFKINAMPNLLWHTHIDNLIPWAGGYPSMRLMAWPKP